MRTIGVIGGIGSGKSHVAKVMAKSLCGCIIDADKIGHRSLEQPEVQMQLEAKNLPTKRNELSKFIFEEPDNLKFLEDITYSFIDTEIHRLLGIVDPRYFDVVILDAPLLIEGGWGYLCDVIVFVNCPREKQLANIIPRLFNPRFCELADAESYLAPREARQMQLNVKKNYAQVIIENFTQTSIEEQIKNHLDVFKPILI